MTSLFSSLLTFMKSTYFRTRHTSETLFPIPATHSIILFKKSCKIGKTGWFSLSGMVL
ncbi:hypothetical protein PARMER_03477 [Parabacteroides merdae ATCC 43184]|nr:hypothetical protein PARMER_03477 [Parabacteroides merdae ATCC 43184]